MKKIIAVSVLCASVLPVAVYAEEHAETHAEGHFENYIGVSASKLTAGPSSTGAAVMLGHHYNENFALEVAYEDSGAISAAPERTTAVSVSAIGIVPLTSGFEAYGRIGYASAHSKDAAGVTASHGNINYGVGVEYRLNEKYSAGLGWGRLVVGDNVGIPRANENSYALSLIRSF